MKLIHNYHPIYTQKLLEMGIAQKGDGFKICHTFGTPENMRFNVITKEDGELYSIVKEFAGSFYVDRLQGGTFYFDYPFSKEIADIYDELTDGNFLGFQLHEMGATRTYDWNRIETQLKANNLDWTEENIYESVKKISFNKDFPHFSQGPAGEYAILKRPKTLKEFYDDLDYVLRMRQIKTHNRVLLCDSYVMVCPLEAKNDIKVSFIEIGGQNHYIRLQFALRRGTSRVAGKKWGVYIEPWSDTEWCENPEPCTAYIFMRNGHNEWFGDPENFIYQAKGEKGGTSMSLARRMMYYSLFAGADYFSEEWGQANTFYEWDTFEMPPYGIFKRDMAALSRRLGEVKAYAPVAIVLPKEYGMVNTSGYKLPYENDITESDYNDIVNRIHKLLYNGSKLGHEDSYFTTGRYGSIFDVIYEDYYEHPEKEYDFLVDFSGKFAGTSDKAVNGFNEQETLAGLDQFVKEALPFTYEASGDVDYMLFEGNGEKFVCFLNHNGITKTLADGETVNPEATVKLQVEMKTSNVKEVLNICDCDFEVSGKALNAVLKGGEFVVVRYE